MKRVGKKVRFWLQSAQWLALTVSALIAVSILVNYCLQQRYTQNHLDERNRLKLSLAKRQTQDYFNEVWLCLRVLSANPDVQNLNPASYDFLYKVYEANYDQHKIPEIYVIQRDFDGSSRPAMTFEQGDEEHETDELHTLEREAQEYAVQMEQIRRFAEDPSLTRLVGRPVPLCVGKPGLVLSVPIRSKGRLRGIVAAMVPSSNVTDVLEKSSVHNTLFAVNGSGDGFGCSDLPPQVASWFHGEFARENVPRFFKNQAGSFRVGHLAAHWGRLDVGDERDWYLASLYDASTPLDTYGLPSGATALAEALLVMLLGGVVVLLCRVVLALRRARQIATGRAEALEDSECRNRSILETAVTGILTINEHGIIESFNAASERLFGYSTEEVLGKNVSILMPPPHDRRHDEYIARYLETGEARIIGIGSELTGRRKDGSLLPIEAAVSEFTIHNRRYFTGVLRDITERKDAERALRKSEERFKAISHYTFTWENWVDPDGQIVWISPTVEKITGYSVDECLATPEYPVFLVHPHDRNRVARALDAARTEQTSGEDERFRIRRKDGRTAWCSISWRPIYGDDGGCEGYRSIIWDITERIRAEQNARARLAELAHLGRIDMLKEMTAGLSHELNQPLAAIVNYVHACVAHIQSGAATEEKLTTILNHASEEAQRAGRIIQHMRSVGRKPEEEPARVDLNEVVTRAVELTHFEEKARGLKVGCALDATPLYVLGDAIQLEQVLINLIRNAVDAVTNDDGPPGKVMIRTFRSGGKEVRCAVLDTGPGLREGECDRMFEPFFSTKSDGMGIGLSISRSIVEAHGGRLWAAANEPRGTVLSLTLPALHEEVVYERITEDLHR